MHLTRSVSCGWAQWLCFCAVLLLPLPSLAQESLQPLLQRLATAGALQIAGASVYDLPVTQEFYAMSGWIVVVHTSRRKRSNVNEVIKPKVMVSLNLTRRSRQGAGSLFPISHLTLG